MDQAEFVQDCL